MGRRSGRSSRLARQVARYAIPLVLVMWAAGAAEGRAQSGLVRLAEPSVFRESFVTNPRVSGRLIVGLHLGRSADPYRSDGLSVAGLRDQSVQQICVRVTTQDARYWALNRYIAMRTPGLGRLEAPTRFAKELAAYNASQVAVRIIAANDCNEDSDGPLVPAVLPGTKPGATGLSSSSTPAAAACRRNSFRRKDRRRRTDRRLSARRKGPANRLHHRVRTSATGTRPPPAYVSTS